MNSKQIIIIVVVIAGAFLAILVSMIAVITYYPSVAGLENEESQDTTKAKTVKAKPGEKWISIRESKLQELESYFDKSRNLQQINDSLIKQSAAINDSARKVFGMRTAFTDSVDSWKKNFNDLGQVNNKLRDSIAKITQDLKQSEDKLKSAQSKIDDQDKYINRKLDTLETKNFETYAKIYNNATPADVAKILSQIDERDASKILKMMSAKKASKVLESMKPEQAAAILLLGGNQ